MRISAAVEPAHRGLTPAKFPRNGALGIGRRARGGNVTMAAMNTCAVLGAHLPETERFCPTCGAPLEEKPESERKLATVVFADLVGSTELGGSQDPERTRGLLDRFYDAMAREIDAAGGTVEKFAGDAVMAGFGAHASLGGPAGQGLHRAPAMQRRLQGSFW